jgi:hypothetical protein
MREIVSPLDGFGSPFGTRRRLKFSPASLFAAGEQGAWFEPSPTTCFTDTTLTTPASVGQAVAGMTDLSGNDNHATQSITSARPILARVPASGRRNLLNNSDNLSAYATLNSPVVTPNAAPNPFGTANDATLFEVGEGQTQFLIRGVGTIQLGQSRTGSVYFKPISVASGARISFGHQDRVPQTPVIFPDLAPNTTQTSGLSNVSVFAEPVGNDGWFRLSSSQTRDSLSGDEVRIGFLAALAGNQILLWRAQYEEGLTMTAPQRVGSTFDVTEAGQPDNFFLFNDLIDDVINWTAPADDYSIARINAGATVTLLASQALSGATNLLNTARTGPYIAVDRALTTAEQGNVTTYLEGKGGGL